MNQHPFIDFIEPQFHFSLSGSLTHSATILPALRVFLFNTSIVDILQYFLIRISGQLQINRISLYFINNCTEDTIARAF